MASSKKTKQLSHSEHATPQMIDLEQRRTTHFENSTMTTAEKLTNFGRFLTRQDIARLACYYDVIRQTEGITGSIVECGVYHGHGLMLFAKMIAAFEPYNYMCQIYGFDTFAGNVGLSSKDETTKENDTRHRHTGGYFADSYSEVLEAIDLFDADRPIAHIPKIHLIKGDLRQTAPAFLQTNAHVMVRILSLTLNLYEPTVAALRTFLPRMPKGSIIMAYALNFAGYPGMVQAILEEVGIRNCEIETPHACPAVNYIKL